MTEMLTRPLTTENRVLRAVSGADLTVSLGQSVRAMFSTPAMGGLTVDAWERAGARSAFNEDEFLEMREAQRERERERAAIAWQLNYGLSGDRDAAYDRLVELDREKQIQLDGFEQQQIADGRLETPEALAETYGELGLRFDRPMTREEARLLADGKRAEIIRNALIDAGPKGFIPGIAKFGAGLAGIATDPLEVATMFIPVVGQAGRLGAISRFGRVGGRVAVGAVEGGVGQALTEPFYYGLSRAAQLDYDMNDTLLNIGLGFVFGGGIGTIAGALSRAEPSGLRARPDIETPGGGRADIETPRGGRADIETPGGARAADMQDARAESRMEARKVIAEQRPAADLALRQFTNGQPVNVADAMPPRADIYDLNEIAARYDVSEIRRFDGEPSARQIEDAGATQAFRVSDAEVAFVRGLKEGQEAVQPVVRPAPVAWPSAPKSAARVERMVNAGTAVARRMDGITDAEVRWLNKEFKAGRMIREGDGMPKPSWIYRRPPSAPAERPGVEEAVARARAPGPLENIQASREADIRQPDDFLERELDDWEAMAGQIERSPEVEAEFAAIRDIEQRADTVAEVAEAAAACIARTI